VPGPGDAGLAPRTALLLGGLGIALFAVLGAAYAEAKDGGPIPTWFRSVPVGLNGEWTLPALYSALLLLTAGVLCFRAAWLVTTSGRFTPLVVLGALFAYMGVDEFLAVHEHLERVVHLAWWKFYAPVAVVGGVAVLLTLRRIWAVVVARSALLAGGACWLLSQLIETQQYDGTELVHRWTILPEEVLEMTGSLLFVVALLAVIGATVPDHRAEDGVPLFR
jgi:hypothetical protein